MSNDAENNGRPVPEVHEKPLRRRFTAEYKMRIIKEANACTDKGQVGELLRREGLYSSHLSNWRRLREQGSLASLKEKKRGRKRKPNDAATQQLKRLQRENQRLAERLRQAETIIDVQKKVCEMLGIATPQNGADSDE
jgi:transposase-like protein